MERKAPALILALLICASSTCAQAGVVPSPPGDDPATLAAPVRALGDSITVLGFDLQRRLGGGNGNLVFSPLSIATALAAVSAGARGATAAELAAALHFPPDETTLHPAFGALRDHLGGRHSISPAPRTRVWAQADQAILPEFTLALRAQYGAEAIRVDFLGHPEAARNALNAWANRTTGRTVPDLLPPDSIDPSTRLYVLSCVDFLGPWQSDFRACSPAGEPFHVAAGRERSVPTMRAECVTDVADAPLCEVVVLPYLPSFHLDATEIALIVLLPRDPDGLAAVQRTASADSLRAWLSPPRLRPQATRVYLPEFNLEFACDLRGQLAAMGLNSAFTPDTADFSGVDGGRDLYLGHLPHRAAIDVGLEGTHATAATAVQFLVSGVRNKASGADTPRIIRIDHPFLFLVFDRRSGCSLFQGRLVDPQRPGPAP